MKKKGVNIKLLSIGLFVLVAVIMTFFGLEMQHVSRCVQEQIRIEEDRNLGETESRALTDGSDYLTGEAWRFVVMRDLDHMENYWNEVHTTKSRETAMERLFGMSLTEQERDFVSRVKAESDGLIETETRAMRLVADSLGLEPSQMPPEVAAVRYSDGEAVLSADEKAALAVQTLFGEEYAAVKETIRNDIASFHDQFRTRKSAELDEIVAKTHAALRRAGYLMLSLMLLIVLEAFLFYRLLVGPLSRYTRSLRRMEKEGFAALEPVGVREVRSLAKAYNRIYEDWRRQKQSLEKEHYRFHVALESTSSIVYEYDVALDSYTACGTLGQGEAVPVRPQQDELIIPNFLKDHAAELMGRSGADYFRRMASGVACGPAEFQMHAAGKDSRSVWVRATGTQIYDGEHRVARLIGKINDIQSEKEKEFALADARSRDGLTGLYQQDAGVARIRSFLQQKPPEMVCTLMLLDMDDFKEINRSEGTAFANALLQEVADLLKAATGPDDILVRLGGDEFMLFLKDCPKSRATVLGPELAWRIQKLGPQDGGLSISASIGMCMTLVVDEYSGLYRCAESALKFMKVHGKGRAVCYLDASNEMGMLLTQMYPERHIINEIDRPESAKEDLPSFALDLLGKAKNLDDAIFLLLARVGKLCGLDRVMIVELDPEYLGCRPVYQWAGDSKDRISADTRFLTREKLQEISAAYDDQGLSDRRIISASGEMASILHAGIWNYGSCVGAMSMERREAHSWTASERELLSELTKIVSSFTLKARADAVNQAKTDFLSRMSHEIRTPMNAISGMTTIAKTVLDDPPKALDCLNKIESANKYLLSLINDVLDMSRIESGKVELRLTATDLSRLTGNLEALVRPQAEMKRLRLLVENGVLNGTQVAADELRLNQILVNLLGNAVKFTGEGGCVTLRIEPVERQGKLLRLRFSVTDNGIGISRGDQGRIFNAFEQAGAEASSHYGGTGLGLAISSRLVQLMGGCLEVQSEPGKGSCFYFTLPLQITAAEDAEEEDGSGDKDGFDSKGKRMLLAEDNELNREIAQEILEMHGFEVEAAKDGQEALECFAKHPPGYYDAILMDIRMPVMGGMEATRRIRTLGRPDSRTVPIVAMTANAFDDDMKKSLENGMDGYLTKPVDVEKLLETLRALLAKKRAVRPE